MHFFMSITFLHLTMRSGLIHVSTIHLGNFASIKLLVLNLNNQFLLQGWTSKQWSNTFGYLFNLLNLQ